MPDTRAMPAHPRRGRARRGLLSLLAAVAVLSAGPGRAADAWPTQDFDVFEGVPWAGSGRPGVAILQPLYEQDQPRVASVPMTPALKQDIDRYLGQVARRMQAMGFGPPKMDSPAGRANGKPAFRVYYFDFAPTGRGSSYARYESGDSELNRFLIALNASRLTEPGPQGPRLTPKAYVDLAHELFHAVQRASPLAEGDPDLPLWMIEGQAEAIGHDIADELGKLPPGYSPHLRWGMRRYYERLAVAQPSAGGNHVLRESAYETSSFWRYLAERAAARGGLPGASPQPRDYRYLARLLARPGPIPAGKALDWLDQALVDDPDLATPLYRLYPEFIAVQADYGGERVQGASSRTRRHDLWLQQTLGACPEVALDPVNATGHARLPLNRVTSRCVRVALDPGVGPLSVDIRAQVASPRIGQQLWLGVSGGARLARAAVSTGKQGGAIADWSLAFAPGQTLDLVVSNIAGPAPDAPADAPRPPPLRTLAHSLDLVFSIPGHLPPSPPAGPPAGAGPARVPNGPGGATAPATVTQGAQTASAERDLQVPENGCGWPASEFGGRCGPTLRVALGSVPAPLASAASVAANGGLVAQVLGNVPVLQAGERVTLAMAGRGAAAPVRVSLALPLLPYGYAGRVEGATIEIEGGGWPRAGSYASRDRLAGSQTYFAPDGVVEIEHYSPIELRGRYEADMVALPLPISDRQAFPVLPVLGRATGRFVVSRPWLGDADFSGPAADTASLGPDVRRAPGGVIATGDPGPASAPVVPGGAAAATDCDCSCAALDKARELLDAMEQPGAGPGQPGMREARCLLACLPELQACALD